MKAVFSLYLFDGAATFIVSYIIFVIDAGHRQQQP